MSSSVVEGSELGLARFVRFAGVSAVLVVVTYLFYHLLLIPPAPPADAPLEEYRAYVTEAADKLITANGLRNLILAVSLIIYMGVYIWTSGGRRFVDNPWGALGLLGATGLMVAGLTSNTLRTVAFLTVDGSSDHPDHFVSLLNLNSVFDRALQLFTGLAFAGFSIAGMRSKTLPKWLSAMGLVYAATTVVTTVGIAWAVSESAAAGHLLMSRTLLGLVWFLAMGILLAWQPATWRARTAL